MIAYSESKRASVIRKPNNQLRQTNQGLQAQAPPLLTSHLSPVAKPEANLEWNSKPRNDVAEQLAGLPLY